MRFWFARGAEISLREQLFAQVVLAILSGDVAPGERLPSTRELARRFRLHPNTVSAAYRRLERDGWLESRRGSGVFVRKSAPDLPADSPLALDHLIANLFRQARERGFPPEAIRRRLREWLAFQPPIRFLLIEPDRELRRIVEAEMREVLAVPVKSVGLRERALTRAAARAIPVVLPSKANLVRKLLPPHAELLTLQIESPSSSLAHWLPAPYDALVAVASRWPEFLKWARAMLLAAGFAPESLIFRDARRRDWQRGLEQAAAVVADSLTAQAVSKTIRVVRFPLLSEPSRRELKRWEQQIRPPLRSRL